ncbi:MAG: phosphatidylinositol mannoside acyltransferase [Actinomycetota bacterium]
MSGLFGYLVVRALSGLLGVLPEPVMRRLGYAIGYLMSFTSPRARAMAERHQRRILGPAADARRAARRVFGHYGRYYAEAFWTRPRRQRGVLGTSTVEGLEILEAAVAAPAGIVLAVAHLGNWEAAGLKAVSVGAPVLAPAEGLPNERLVRWFIAMRAMMGIDVVIVRRGTRVTEALARRLEEGGVVAVMSDRDLKGTGIPVTMFGEETTMPAGPLTLACRTGATVLPVGTYFNAGPGHLFHVHPPLEVPATGSFEERVQEGTRRLAVVLEEMIARAPEQWHVLQPVWPSDREGP